MNCAFCGTEISASRIHIRDECSACGRDLHICLHCSFYDANAYRQCRESIKEPVHDKEKANYCDFFCASESGAARVGSGSDAFKKLHDLFK
jgi:hypothetical protein